MADAQPYTEGTDSNVSLFAGPHKFNLLYFQGPATNIGLEVDWQGPSNAGLGTMGIIPSSAFTY
jgi:hypothetical protein